MALDPPAGAGARPAPVPTRRIALVIWASLLAGVVLFALVATAVGPGVRQGRAPGAGLPESLGWMALGLAVLMLLLSRVIPRLVKAAPGASPEATGVARTIVAVALNEGAGLFAIIVWLLGGSPLALVPLAIAVAGILLAFPSAARWRALCVAPGEAPRPPLVR